MYSLCVAAIARWVITNWGWATVYNNAVLCDNLVINEIFITANKLYYIWPT